MDEAKVLFYSYIGMNRFSNKQILKRNILLRVSILLVLCALGIIALLQYQWFTRAATGEIEHMHRNLSASVLRTVAQEFQKYTLLLSEPSADAREYLERVYLSYGPEGDVPGLIVSAGYIDMELPAKVVFYSGKEIGWNETENKLAEGLTPMFSRGDGRRRSLFYFDSENTLNTPTIIAVSYGRGGGLIYVFGIDLPSFFSIYAKPAVEAVLPEYNIIWRESPYPEFGHAQEAGYRFSPLKGLFGKPGNGRVELSIPVPRIGGNLFDRGEPDNPPPHEVFRFSPKPQGQETYVFADLYPKDRSWAGIIEKRLALGWLSGTLLLLLVGMGYIVLVLQIEKLRGLRTKERDFVASVTHELRTPITVIQSAADNLKQGIVGPDRTAFYGELIMDQTLRLGGMVEEVLAFSRLEGGSIKPGGLVPTDFIELFNRLKADMSGLAKAEKVLLVWDTGSLPAKGMSDPESVALIIKNIISNALFHAYKTEKRGEVRIIVKIHFPDKIVVTIEDDGIGIPSGEAKAVFEPFYRTKLSRESQERGSGLGLFLAKRKTHSINGSIKLESPYERADGRLRQGCRFIIDLPYIPLEGNDEKDTDS